MGRGLNPREHGEKGRNWEINSYLLSLISSSVFRGEEANGTAGRGKRWEKGGGKKLRDKTFIYLSLFHELILFLSWGYRSVRSLKLSEVDKLCMQIYLQENVPVNAISEW